MLKGHMGSSGDHFGTSLVTSTSPPRAARWLTVTTSKRLFRLHTFITLHNLLLFQSSTQHQWKAFHEICQNPPLPQRP
eukprot:4318795-Prymnesium_polylepis.1